jgi:homoserine dehydrogenase
MKVQVVGFGGLGRNLLRLINEKNGMIVNSFGEKIDVVSVSDRSGTVVTDGMPLTRIIQAKESEGLKALDSFEKMSALSAIRDVEADVVVELTNSTSDGHPGIDHIMRAFEEGKNAVTANKSTLIVEPNIMKVAREMRMGLRYEATVCGGIPVFNLMDYSIRPSRIRGVDGIFNATSSFVISKMEEGNSLEEAIADATRIGLAEKEPRDDLEGIDSARKGTILHRRVFGSDFSIKDADISSSVKEMAPGRRQVTVVGDRGVKVEYSAIKKGDIFGNVRGASMIIRFDTDTFDHITLFTDHDGPLESAAGVLNDILLMMRDR